MRTQEVLCYGPSKKLAQGAKTPINTADRRFQFVNQISPVSQRVFGINISDALLRVRGGEPALKMVKIRQIVADRAVTNT